MSVGVIVFVVVLALCGCVAKGTGFRNADTTPRATPGEATGSIAADLQISSVTPWMSNADPLGWSSSPDRVFYNHRNPSTGLYDGYSANPDGSDPTCLTCRQPDVAGVGAATQRGVADVSPNGRFMLVTVESSAPLYHHGQYSEPGDGVDNDIYLATTDGKHYWRLTDVASEGTKALAIIWPRFDRTGTRIVWSQCYFPAVPPLNLGYWVLKTATISWSGGVPRLTDITTIDPHRNAFYEPYGFTPDDSRIIFASDVGLPNWGDDQIFSIKTNGTGLQRLSQNNGSIFNFTNYNEFAFYLPRSNAILYGRTYGSHTHGIDLWAMNANGSDPQRLTYFNEAWSTESHGYANVVAMEFDPSNPLELLVGVENSITGQDINAYLVTLGLDGVRSGLTGAYFAGSDFSRQVARRIENPSAGFAWTNALLPAGVSLGNFSVRWTGSLHLPVTGAYRICVVADSGARLYLSGQPVASDLQTPGQRACTSLHSAAGRSVPLRLDYVDTTAAGYVQLSWQPPGASRLEIIPFNDLSPGG